MPDRARQKAIDTAFANDDLLVISSIMNAHRLELGNVSLPLDYTVDRYIRSKAPEEMADADAMGVAVSELETIWSSFGEIPISGRELMIAKQEQRLKTRELPPVVDAGTGMAVPGTIITQRVTQRRHDVAGLV